jgi:hypothetical protein
VTVPGGFGEAQAPPRRGCLAVFLWLSGLGCAGFAGLCLLSVLVLAATADETSPTPLSRLTDPLVRGATISLGSVTVPEGATATASHDYRWPWDWHRYQVQYGVDASVLGEVKARQRRLARRMHFEDEPGGQFRWAPPRSCGDEPWTCVYQQSGEDNRAWVAGLAQAFLAYQREHGLDARTTVELVISWVQNIAYRVPEGEPFGLLPATRVAAEGWGDCDSKALLAALVLDALGVETVVLSSPSFRHAALGVAVPAQGQSWTFRGDRYYYAEVTAPGWTIGTMPPGVDTPRAWTVIPWK